MAVDAFDNLYIASRTVVRQIIAGIDGVVDDRDDVRTMYGAPPRATFPESTTQCIAALAVPKDDVLVIADACQGIVVALVRQPEGP